MKKLLIALLGMAVVIPFAGCGNDDDSGDSETSADTDTDTDTDADSDTDSDSDADTGEDTDTGPGIVYQDDGTSTATATASAPYEWQDIIAGDHTWTNNYTNAESESSSIFEQVDAGKAVMIFYGQYG